MRGLAAHIGEVHVIVIAAGGVGVPGPGVSTPAPAVLGKNPYNGAVFGDGIGVAARLPVAARQDLSIFNLVILGGVDVNGGAAVVFAGGAVPRQA